MNWIKEHPFLAGALVLAIVVLFFLMRRGGGSSASAPAGTSGTVAAGPSESLQALQLQTGAAVQAQQIAAVAHTNEVNAQLAAVQVNANRDIVVKQLEQQTNLQNIVTSGQVQMHSTDAALDAIKAQVGGQVSIADTEANRDITVAGIQADVNKTALEQATEQQAIISAAQEHQADVAGTVAITGISAQRDVALHGEDVYGAVQAGAQQVQEDELATLLQSHEADLNFASQNVKNFGGSQNRLSLLLGALGGTSAAAIPSVQSSEAAQNQPFDINHFIPPISVNIPGVGGGSI